MVDQYQLMIYSFCFPQGKKQVAIWHVSTIEISFLTAFFKAVHPLKTKNNDVFYRTLAPRPLAALLLGLQGLCGHAPPSECKVLPLMRHVSSKGGPLPTRALTKRADFKASVIFRCKHTPPDLCGVFQSLAAEGMFLVIFVFPCAIILPVFPL